MEERKGLYYCPDCNEVYEYANVDSKEWPRCIHPEHERRAEISSKQYIDWILKDNPVLDIKKKESEDVQTGR